MDDVYKNDEELWLQTGKSREEAFEQLMARYMPALLHYGGKFSNDSDLVQDCVQDVMADVWLRRSREVPIISVKAYLFSAVRHSVCRESRKARRTAFIHDSGEVPFFEAAFSIEDTLIADEAERERLGKLRELINALPPRQKEVIYLRYYQGLEKDQIAEVLNINYQSVSNLLHRSLTALRKQFPVLLVLVLTFNRATSL